MTRGLVAALAAAAAACAAPAPLTPDSEPAAAAIDNQGIITGAALGFALGSEVHVFIADSAFTHAAWERLVRRPPSPAGPPLLVDQWARRGVVAIAADRLHGRGDPALSDATVLHALGSAPARLELLRLHRPGHCTVPTPVAELVLVVPRTARTAAPEPHAAVVALLHAPLAGTPARSRALADLPAASTRRLVAGAALAAESLLARRAGEPVGAALSATVAADRDRAADAGEAVPLPGEPGRFAVGVRVRFLAARGDTVLVSGVAITDINGRGLTWLFGPVRASLTRGLARSGSRYSLRAALRGPPGVLFIHQIADVSAAGSRSLAVEPGERRLLAARPLALRCP